MKIISYAEKNGQLLITYFLWWENTSIEFRMGQVGEMSMLYVGRAGIIKREILGQVMCSPNKGGGAFLGWGEILSQTKSVIIIIANVDQTRHCSNCLYILSHLNLTTSWSQILLTFLLIRGRMRLRRVETLTQGYSVLLASSIDEWGK